jgi:predicted AAA+ superfamily ATPase
MSKKPKKKAAQTAPRATPKAASRGPAKTATKRPADALNDATAERIATALEAIAGHLSAASSAAGDDESFGAADAFVWHPDGRLAPVPRVSRVDLGLLKGIDRMRDILIENTERFADGLPANNALLWGARGMGKSSLVKATHANINIDRKPADRLKLIEIHREDIESLPGLMDLLRNSDFRFIVFCDDLSFDGNDASYKSLKAVLEGGIEGRPDNVILYATSNRRHLLAREMIENERDQPGRSGRGEGLAVGSFWSLARLPSLQPGRISGDGPRLLRPFRHRDGRRRIGARGAGMVDHPRLAFGPRGLAVHAGTGGTAGRAAFGEVGYRERL